MPQPLTPLPAGAQSYFRFTELRVQSTVSHMGPDNEHTVAVLVILGICGLAIYRFVLWIMKAPRMADPWGKDAEEALDREEAVPLCHHCFTPQEHNGWFCPECGATTGPYSNYLPYVYIFSQGEVLRAGTTERLRPTAMIVVGYVLLSLSLYAIAAPVYWFFLFKHLRKITRAGAEPGLNG